MKEMRLNPEKARKAFNKKLAFKKQEQIAKEAIAVIGQSSALPEHHSIELRNIPSFTESAANYNVSLKYGRFPIAHVYFTLSPTGRITLKEIKDFSDQKPLMKKASKLYDKLENNDKTTTKKLLDALNQLNNNIAKKYGDKA